MLRSLLDILAPANATEQNSGRNKTHVRVILTTLAIIALLIVVLNSDFGSQIGAGILLVYALSGLLLSRHGYVRISRITIPFITWIILSILIWLGMGLHSVTVPSLCLVILFAALLGSRRAALIYLILSMLTMAVVLVGEHHGYVDNGLPRTSTYVEMMNLYMILIFLTIALMALMRYMESDRDAAVESEQQYRLLADNVYDFIWTTDMEFNYLYASPSCEKLVGYTQDELTGTSAETVIHPDSMGMVREAMAEELENDADRNPERYRAMELQFIAKDGSIKWVESHNSFLRDESGNPIGLVGTTRDISDRKRTEQEKRDIEDRLQRSERISSIGQLAGGIAHDFNNLLAVIQGYSDFLMASDTLSSTDKEHVSEIHRASERAADLTRQLLAFGRRQVPTNEPTNLNVLIANVETMLSRLIPKTIQCTFIPGDELQTINCDTGQIEQLLTNLALNSRDAMPDGGTLTIETDNVVLNSEQCKTMNGAVPGSYVRLAVKDTGSGMSPEVIKKVFEPFFTTKDVGKGTGLGMSVVHGIVTSHKALIQIHSEEGAGTSIEIYFPEADDEIAEEPSVENTDVRGGSETILLVEDDEQVRRFAGHALSNAGYTVVPASNGVDGFEQYRTKGSKIQLILTDVVMPRLGGHELMKRIREIDDIVPIVFCSGYLPDETYTEFVRAGRHPLLQKPYSTKDLLGIIRHELDQVIKKI